MGQHHEIANSYYGSSPFDKNADYYAGATFQNIATGRMKVSNVQEALNTAYRAAYTVKLREAEIQILQAQIAALQQALHAALEQLNAEQEARAKARQEAEAQAREQERAIAEAEAQKAQELSAVRAANTYNLDFSAGVSLRFAAALSAAGQVFPDIISTQVTADAIAELKNARVAGLARPLGVGIAALLYPSELGNGELPGNYLLSTSLADLGVDVGSEAQAAALARGTLNLPVRMASQSEGAARDAVVVAGTEGKANTSAVRVLAATLDTETGNYSITTEDTPSRVLVWTPVTIPESNSTTSPATSLPATTYVGPTLEPLQGRLDSFPELEDTGFDDYVVIFPSDSGLPPLYLMFRSRRHMPGVVVGMGEDMAGALLIENNRQGSNIPEQIAGKMRGQKFSSFGAFRSSFWMWVADTQELSVQFDRADLHMMRRGLAPLALPGERVGGRIKYEIHHKVRIADGGDVYDVSNMIILSPKFHIEAHR